jgi:type IV pilus assembly protein PilM
MADKGKLPKFLGIDIGKNTTKVTSVDWKGEKAELTHAFSFETGNGNLTSEDANSRADLSTRIKDAVTGAKLPTKKAVVALPEPSIFNRLLTFPDLKENELNEAIHWNAKQFIPIPVEDVQMDWIKTADMNVNGKKMLQLLLVAAPKKLIKQTVSIFEEAGLELIAVETESVATARVVAHNYPDGKATLVLDIGSAGTDLSVVANNFLIFSQSLSTGSDAMTQAIASAYSIDSVQAEQYKVKFGLKADQGDGKILQVLEPVVNIIVGEITKTINFFRNKYQQSTPQRILILGEGGKIPGLPEYLGQKLGIQTELANLNANINISSDIKSEIDSTGLSGYAVSLGLALKQE